MQKFLGIGFQFSAVDKGLKSFFRQANNDAQKLEGKMEEVAEQKPVKGSIWDKISEISKLGMLKGISDKLDDINEAEGRLTGRGLSDDFKNVEKLAARLSIRLGVDVTQATKKLNAQVNDLVKNIGLTSEKSVEIIGAFEKNGLQAEKFGKSISKTAMLVKAFDADTNSMAEAFGIGAKNLGLSQETMEDIANKAALLEGKSGLEGIVGNLPEVIKTVQEQINRGLISPAQAAAQAKRILEFQTRFRNAGLTIADTQKLTESLLNTSEQTREAFAEIALGKTGKLPELAKAFGLVGMNISDVAKAFQSGDIGSAIGQIQKAAQGASKLGGGALQTFALGLKDAFGEDAMAILRAANTDGYSAIGDTIKEVNSIMKDAGRTSLEINGVFQKMTNTVEEQEEKIKGLGQAIDKNVSLSISDAIKSYNSFRIKSLSSLADVENGNGTMVQNMIIGLKKFQQAGLIPFADSIASTFGISTDAIYAADVAFKEVGGAIKDSLDEVYFFTGVLANLNGIMKLSTILEYKDIAAKKLKTVALAAYTGGTIAASGATNTLSKGLMFAGGAVRGLLGPVGLAITAVGLLATGFKYVYDNSETFRGIVDGLWGGIKNLSGSMWDFAKGVLPKVWEGLKTAAIFAYKFGTPFGLIQTALQYLGEKFPQVFSKIKEYLNPLIMLFEKLTGGIGKIFDKVGSFVKNSTVGKIYNEVTGGGVKPTATQAAPVTVPNTVSANNQKTIQPSSPINQPGMEASSKFVSSVNPTQTAAKADEASKNIEDPNIKALAQVFSLMGADIITAIQEGKQNITIELKGDAKSLFKAQTKISNTAMAGQGVTP